MNFKFISIIFLLLSAKLFSQVYPRASAGELIRMYKQQRDVALKVIPELESFRGLIFTTENSEGNTYVHHIGAFAAVEANVRIYDKYGVKTFSGLMTKSSFMNTHTPDFSYYRRSISKLMTDIGENINRFKFLKKENKLNKVSSFKAKIVFCLYENTSTFGKDKIIQCGEVKAKKLIAEISSNGLYTMTLKGKGQSAKVVIKAE